MVFNKSSWKNIPSWLFRAYIAIFGILYLYQGDIIASIIFGLMLIVSLIPIVIDEWYNIQLHWLHDAAFSFLIFAHMAGFSGLYNAVPLWDDFAHFMGMMIITMIGFSFLYAYDVKGHLKITLPMIGFFSACFAISTGAVWEIFEFIWDNLILLSINYGFAQNGLVDTMLDLTIDFLGSFVAALILIYYVRKASDKNKEKFFTPFIKIVTIRKGIEN